MLDTHEVPGDQINELMGGHCAAVFGSPVAAGV